MTLDALKEHARRALAEMEAQMRRTGEALPYFVFEVHGKLKPIPIPGEIAARCMNSGDAKDLLFDAIRRLAEHVHATAVLIGTDSWRAEATPLGEMHIEEFRENTDRGFARLLELGWVKRTEALTVTAQTEDYCVIATLPYERSDAGTFLMGEIDVKAFRQAEYAGRTKMFGETTVEEIDRSAAEFWKKRPRQ